MDIVTARARIHAMFPILDNPVEADARATELDQRINELAAEVLRGAADAAAVIHDGCRNLPGRCTRCEIREDILDVLRSVAGVIGEQPAAATPPAGDASS